MVMLWRILLTQAGKYYMMARHHVEGMKTWHNLPVGQEAHVDANSGDHFTLYPIQKL